MNNLDIRIELLKKDLNITQLANILNITRTSLSRKLRYELPEEEKERIMNVIKEIKEEGRK